MSGVQSQKFTCNSTWIARFVAKLAYMYEVCSTYIHISMCRGVCIGLHQQHSLDQDLHQFHSLETPRIKSADSGIRIHEIQFSEIKFMNKKAGIASHER